MRKQLEMVLLLAVSLIMAAALAGCISHVSDIQQDDKPDTSKLDDKTTDNMAAQTDIQPQYFFINGSLLGSYDDDGWHSLCDTGNTKTDSTDVKVFYAKDLLDQDSYYVYENNKQVGVSSQMVWITEEAYGLGSFEAEDAPQKFAGYGRLYSFEGDSSTAYRIFDLPVKLGPELAELKIPDYSFHTDFVYGAEWERHSSSDRLVTNSSADLFPRKMRYSDEPTTEGLQSLIDLFKANNMENASPNFTECVTGDFDNDGNAECLMLAENPVSELGYPLLCGDGKTDHLGVFNVIFYQDDDGSIQTLYSDLRPYQGEFKADENGGMELMGGPPYSIRIALFTAADLNSDGVYEIGVKKNEWESGFYLTYAMDARDKYEIVMRSDFGS